MAITIDWPTQVITIPRADMPIVQSVPTEIRRLDTDLFRLDLKALEYSEEGMSYLDTHSHVAPINVGGVDLARVIEIINGYTVTFEDGQYAVNLIGSNNNIADVTNVNQVSVRSGNSAGLVDLPAIRLQSFTEHSVWIDTNLGSSGTAYPWGTPTRPVNNLTDAITIQESINLHGFHIEGTIVLDQDIDGTEWFSPSPINGILIASGQNTFGCTFHQMGITGQMNGRASYDICALGGPLGISGFSGIARQCGFNGDITLDATNVENVLFFQCASVIAGTNKPVLDCNGSVGDVHIRDWTGGLKITNFTAGNDMSIDCSIGSIEIDSSCTAGTIKVRMNATKSSLIDNSGAGCTVITEDVVLEPVLAINVG